MAAPPLDSTNDEDQPIKVSHAEITLKSATLPRRKTSHADGFQFGIQNEAAKKPESRFQTDLRSAPIREHQYQSPYSPVFAPPSIRSTSLEPQQQNQRPKEHYIPIQRPSGYMSGTVSSSQKSVGSMLSRQSTVESDTSDTQTQTSTATIGAQSSSATQPIKKSPREFIIPISVEGGGFVTPRAGSLEPSESNHSSSTTFSRLGGKPKKFG